MSDAADRLQRALTALVKDAADLWLAHADVHAKAKGGCGCGGAVPDGTTGAEAQASYTVAGETACAPAHVGPGEVRVGVPPQTGETPLAPLTVVPVPAGSQSTATYPATTNPKVPPGQSAVVVSIPTTLPVGTYVGRVRDAAGAVSSPFVIYLDGLQ